MKGSEEIPYKLLMYLLDLSDANGYVPQDDNEKYPRCRLAKYLCYDGARPLDNPLPSDRTKLSLLFDPEKPDINTEEDKAKHPLGYRLFMQRIIGQSDLEAKTLIKCYLDRTVERRKFLSTIGVTVEIWCNVNFLTNTRTTEYDRPYNIEQCIHEALDGVHIAGVGTVSFCQGDSTYNGSSNIYNESSAVGRVMRFTVNWAESETIQC